MSTADTDTFALCPSTEVRCRQAIPEPRRFSAALVGEVDHARLKEEPRHCLMYPSALEDVLSQPDVLGAGHVLVRLAARKGSEKTLCSRGARRCTSAAR